MDQVAVRLAGPFAVTFDKRPDEAPRIASRKARRLLMLLAVHRGELVAIHRIVDVLWADQPPRDPEQNVATLVSRLRSALGPYVIVGGRHGYRLGSAPHVWVDLVEAGQLIAEAKRRLAAGEPAVAAVAAARGLEMLAAGPLLADEPDADWVLAARADAQRLMRDGRHAAAGAALLTADPQAAIKVSTAAIVADRFDEAAHRQLMRAYWDAGEPAKALVVYERLRRNLAAELGVDPSPETRAVHLAVLREQQVDSPTVRPSRPTAADLLALPGRAGESTRLNDSWAAAVAGEQQLVLITGEAGIGKTRLAVEVAAIAESTGGLVLQARCYTAERSLFLQPFVDALAAAMTAMRPDLLRRHPGAQAAANAGLLPGVADVFDPSPVNRGSPEVERRRAFEAVTTVVSGLAANRPVLLVLDDLQNAGQATVEMLHFLARHAGRARLLVVATVRSEEGVAAIDALSDVADRIELGPLPADAVLQLATAAGCGELADMIVRRTRGHALFVTETLRAVVSGESGIPESLRAAVLARLRRAGPEIEELLRAGAVLGASVDPAIVGGLLDVTASVAARRCERAARTRLLVAAGRSYEFANDLVQEVLYATTPVPTRVTYHRRAADLLADRPESVATHAEAVGDWPRAAGRYLLAGQQAAHRYALTDAQSLLDRAMQAAERTGQLDIMGRIYVARSRVWALLGSHRLAWGDARAGAVAARQAGNLRLEMLALQEHTWDTRAGGVPIGEVVADLHDSLWIAETLGDRAAQAEVLGRLAVISGSGLLFVDALDQGHAAVRAGRASGNDEALDSALGGLLNAYAFLGEVEQTTRLVAEQEPLQRRLGALVGLGSTFLDWSFVSIADADWDLARDRLGEAMEINRRSGFAPADVSCLAHLGWIDRLQGGYERALRHGTQALAVAEQASDQWWRPFAIGMLAVTLSEYGEKAQATKLLMDAHSALGPRHPKVFELRILAPLAELTGSPATLLKADNMLRGISAPSGSAWLLGTDFYLSVARAWLDKGEPRRARAVLEPLLVAAERQHWLPALAGGLLVDGRAATALGDDAFASTQLNRALALAVRHGMPPIADQAQKLLAIR